MMPTRWFTDRTIAETKAAMIQAHFPEWTIKAVPRGDRPELFGVRAERTLVDINETYVRRDGRVGHSQVAWLKVNGQLTIPED